MKEKANILVVDDEPHVRRILKLALDREGYQVDEASNGQIALEKIRQHPPQVLITDIAMPQMTGKELCHHLKEEKRDQNLLICIMTSRTEIEHRAWAHQLAHSVFLEKPPSIQKLLSLIEHYLSQTTSPPNT